LFTPTTAERSKIFEAISITCGSSENIFPRTFRLNAITVTVTNMIHIVTELPTFALYRARVGFPSPNKFPARVEIPSKKIIFSCQKYNEEDFLLPALSEIGIVKFINKILKQML
jgi:hypothetical protein